MHYVPFYFFKFIIVVAPHKSEKCGHLEYNAWVRLRQQIYKLLGKDKLREVETLSWS